MKKFFYYDVIILLLSWYGTYVVRPFKVFRNHPESVIARHEAIPHQIQNLQIASLSRNDALMESIALIEDAFTCALKSGHRH